MALLAIGKCALPMADLTCPVLLQLTLCPLSAGPRPPQTSSQAWTMFSYTAGRKSSATLGTKPGKAQPCVNEPFEDGSENLPLSLFRHSQPGSGIAESQFSGHPFCLPITPSGLIPWFSLPHSQAVKFWQSWPILTPALALVNQSNTTHPESVIGVGMCPWPKLDQWQSYLRRIEMLSARVTKLVECKLELLVAIFVPT